MPITEAFVSRKMCVGAPKQGYAEKRKKMKKAVDWVTVLKAGLGYNPYRAKSGLFAAAGASEGFKDKDQMRITNLAKEGPKMQARATQMAKSITDLNKAYRRANAAEAAGHADVAKIFRARAKEISKARSAGGGGGTEVAKPSVTLPGGQKLPESWQALVTHAQAKSALTAEAKAPATPMHPSDKAKLEAIVAKPHVAATTVTPSEKAVTAGAVAGGTPRTKYQPTYDKEGYISGKSAPDAKDAMRIENIMKQSGMDQTKMAKAATQMAASITNADKAYRRGMAATNENVHGVAKIFYDRADALAGAKAAPKMVPASGVQAEVDAFLKGKPATTPGVTVHAPGTLKELGHQGAIPKTTAEKDYGPLGPPKTKLAPAGLGVNAPQKTMPGGPGTVYHAQQEAAASAPKTHSTWVTGMPSKDSGGTLSTSNPEKNWLVAESPDRGVMLLERPGGGKPIVVAGSGGKVGDSMDIHDDGNGATAFGSKTPTRYKVTHIASNMTEIKSLPKGKYRFYVQK